MQINKFDDNFKKALKTILDEGSKKEDRTGTGTISYPGLFFRHDMKDGFPLLTLRKTPFTSAAVELEGFINGITSKKWYKERGCNYWNDWCNPKKIKYSNDSETKKKMAAEDDLGLIYGAQMRDFHCPDAVYVNGYDQYGRSREGKYKSRSIDQLKRLVNILHENPEDRRMVVSYWNPLALDYQSLPACHTQWMVNVVDGKLNLSYTMRSCDWILGNNLNSYGLLLHLLAKEGGFKEGVLSAIFHDAHIYNNHIEGANKLLKKKSFAPPLINTKEFTDIFYWKAEHSEIVNYESGPAIKFPVAV